MSTSFRRTTTTVLAGFLLLTGITAAADATPQGHERQDHPAGRFYGNLDLGILLFTGDTVTAICDGVDEPVVTARVFDRRDGSVDLAVDAEDLPIHLYQSALGAPEFIDATCAAMFDDDPSTVPVEPFANGTANFRERISAAPDGVEAHVNGVNGFATSPDGTTWKVRTWADFVVDGGVLIGDPSEFQGLSLHRIGG